MTEKEYILNFVVKHGRISKFEIQEHFSTIMNGDKRIFSENVHRHLRALRKEGKLNVSDDKIYYSVPGVLL